MARTSLELERNKQANLPSAAPAGDAPRVNPVTEKARTRQQKAYELTDERGHRAYAWRVDREWVVSSEDPALRRRIVGALKKPLWVTEDVLAEDGSWWSTRVRLQPDDPRYANRLLLRWGQIGLDDLDVEVVILPDRQPVTLTANGR